MNAPENLRIYGASYGSPLFRNSIVEFKVSTQRLTDYFYKRIMLQKNDVLVEFDYANHCS